VYNNFNTDINGGRKNVIKRIPCKYSPTVNLFIRAKCLFRFYSTSFVNKVFIDGFITGNLGLLSVPNNVPNTLNEKAIINDMFQINVKKTDSVQHIMKCTDVDKQDYGLFQLGRQQAKRTRTGKYWVKKEIMV
jgi:hypothetical protein